MGYPLQTGAPQVTVQGRTFAVGAFLFNNPMGAFYKIGVFELDPASGWTEVQGIGMYTNPGDLLRAIQTGGGVAKFIGWIVAQVNAFFARLCGATVAPVGEPATEAQAQAAVTAGVNALAFATVDGVPVLK